MLFNSISFAIFLPIVFLIYWFFTKNNLKFQNILLLISSYFFYSCWNYKFLFLLIFSTLLDYFSGIKIYQSKNKKNKLLWLWLSIIINLGFLGIFKYYNFFADSFINGLQDLGIKANYISINVILPVGISFYTFHGLSYVLDIYNDKIKPEKSFVNYSVFVSFFPLLVAGPIERATHLLPQIIKKRNFEYSKAVDGLRQILWGLFKKIVIADYCADYANLIFNNSTHYSGLSLFLGAFFFAIQIYCDFSGYSDIALGTAKLFGIELLRNFAFPYFSRDIAEFWRRWHISLSSWFRDYLYIPLGGSKGNIWMKVRNTFIIFIVSGFWHGANWTFIFWGFLNALFIMPSIIFNKNRKNLEIVAKGKIIPSFNEAISILFTFLLTLIAWVFFRSGNIKIAFNFIHEMFSGLFYNWTYKQFVYLLNYINISLQILILFFIAIEWLGRENQFAIANLKIYKYKFLKYMFYYIVVVLIILYGGKDQQFIYFQF